MKNKKYLSTLLLIVLCFAFAKLVHAQPTPATLTLNPGTSTIAASGLQTIYMVVNTGSHAINSIQVVATVTGDAAQNSIIINPLIIAGLNRSYSSVTDITNGKQFAYIYSIPDVDQPFSSGNVNLIQIQFVAPTSGNETITFDVSNTMIEKSDGQGGVIEVLEPPTNATYTVQAAVEPSITPTETPIPSPTPTLTPIPTPITNDGVINLTFRLQGIDSAIPESVTFTLKNAAGANLSNFPTTQTVTPDVNGVYAYTFPNLPRQVIHVCIKAPSHLTRCTVPSDSTKPEDRKRDVDLTSVTTATLDMSTHSYNQLIVGDVWGNSGQPDNKINQVDLSKLLSDAVYNTFINPVPEGCPQCDVNRDSKITVEDVALVLMNYTNFEVLGDN